MTLGVKAKIQATVNASVVRAFRTRNVSLPEWWGDASDEITNKIIEQFDDLLEQRDKANRIKRSALWVLSVVLSLIIGALFGSPIERLMAELRK